MLFLKWIVLSIAYADELTISWNFSSFKRTGYGQGVRHIYLISRNISEITEYINILHVHWIWKIFKIKNLMESYGITVYLDSKKGILWECNYVYSFSKLAKLLGIAYLEIVNTNSLKLPLWAWWINGNVNWTEI